MTDPLDVLIHSLHAGGRIRVWSLVTTIFGDVVLHRGGRISTSQLLELMERIGVEAGAVRTALSRLAQDGWIKSERVGRRSSYRISAHGREESEVASHQIYRGPIPEPDTWSLVYADKTPREGLELSNQVFLVPGTAREGIAVTGRLTAGRALIPDKIVSDPHRAALKGLLSDLGSLPTGDLLPLDALTARVLLIHRWRRIVLHYPEIPVGFLPNGIHDPRVALARAYPALFQASESWIDAPSASKNIQRFQYIES